MASPSCSMELFVSRPSGRPITGFQAIFSQHVIRHGDRPGFVQTVDPRSAQRQFKVSLAVATVLAVAIGSSAFALHPASGFDATSQRAEIVARNPLTQHRLDARLASTLATGG